MINKAHPNVNLNIEDLWNTFRVPVFDSDFIDGLGHISKKDIQQIVRWLHDGERLAEEGKIHSRKELEDDSRWSIVGNRYRTDLERAGQLLMRIEENTGAV